MSAPRSGSPTPSTLGARRSDACRVPCLTPHHCIRFTSLSAPSLRCFVFMHACDLVFCALPVLVVKAPTVSLPSNHACCCTPQSCAAVARRASWLYYARPPQATATYSPGRAIGCSRLFLALECALTSIHVDKDRILRLSHASGCNETPSAQLASLSRFSTYRLWNSSARISESCNAATFWPSGGDSNQKSKTLEGSMSLGGRVTEMRAHSTSLAASLTWW